MSHQFHLFLKLLASCLLLMNESYAGELVLGDVHLHYNRSHADSLNAEAIATLLKENKVRLALVTSAPASLALELAREAPENILPILGVYDAYADKQSWHQNTSLVKKIQRELTRGNYLGIGELHLFAANRHSPVFQDIVSLASRYKLPLLMHCEVSKSGGSWRHGGAPGWLPRGSKNVRPAPLASPRGNKFYGDKEQRLHGHSIADHSDHAHRHHCGLRPGHLPLSLWHYSVVCIPACPPV